MITDRLREKLMFKALGEAARARQIASYALLGGLRPQMTSDEIEDLLSSIERLEGADIATEARSLIRDGDLPTEAA
jgi:hypothetical protein